jgi:hypothetical protein
LKNTGSGHSLKLNQAVISPTSASPAMNPDAISIPVFSILARCAWLKPFR